MILKEMEGLPLVPILCHGRRHRNVPILLKLQAIIILKNIMKNITESIRTGLYMVVRQLRPCRAEVYIIFH